MTRPAAMPFPVVTPYRIRADVTPLHGPHTIRDEEAPAYAEAKRAVLDRAPERHRLLAADAEPAGLARALERFATVAADEQEGSTAGRELREAAAASRSPAAAEGASTRRTLCTRRDVLVLADRVALAVQEDLVVMRAGHGAELLHVCFPSHWDPGTHAGSPLAALHGPVPHGERLRASSDNLLRAMIEKGPFERYVWSLNASGALCQHPSLPRPTPTEGPLVEQLWLRVERQTTLPLPYLGRSVFTIRIFQAPLAGVLRVEPGRATGLADAVEAMDDTLRAYKGIAGIGDRLCDELRSWCDPATSIE